MATLIPALGTCVSRMTTGERRLGERLEQKLDDDYLVWYDVPIGPKQWHPDFVVLHPRRGLLILEVKDWRLDTLRQVDREVWEIAPDGVPKNVPNPFVQARHYAHEVVNALERDARLVEARRFSLASRKQCDTICALLAGQRPSNAKMGRKASGEWTTGPGATRGGSCDAARITLD